MVIHDRLWIKPSFDIFLNWRLLMSLWVTEKFQLLPLNQMFDFNWGLYVMNHNRIYWVRSIPCPFNFNSMSQIFLQNLSSSLVNSQQVNTTLEGQIRTPLLIGQGLMRHVVAATCVAPEPSSGSSSPDVCFWLFCPCAREGLSSTLKRR